MARCCAPPPPRPSLWTAHPPRGGGGASCVTGGFGGAEVWAFLASHWDFGGSRVTLAQDRGRTSWGPASGLVEGAQAQSGQASACSPRGCADGAVDSVGNSVTRCYCRGFPSRRKNRNRCRQQRSGVAVGSSAPRSGGCVRGTRGSFSQRQVRERQPPTASGTLPHNRRRSTAIRRPPMVNRRPVDGCWPLSQGVPHGKVMGRGVCVTEGQCTTVGPALCRMRRSSVTATKAGPKRPTCGRRRSSASKVNRPRARAAP